MPIYEYRCEECGSQFEVIRSVKDADAPITCKKCQGSQTFRKMSVFFSSSGEKSVAVTAGGGGGCSGCAGGSCSSCGH